MHTDPTWPDNAFDPHNKKLIRLRPWYFLTWPEEIFFDAKGKILKYLGFLGEIFQTQTKHMAVPTRPKQQKLTLIKIFDLDPFTSRKANSPST